MNKHLTGLCYVLGEPISRDPSGKVTKREAGAISFLIDGTYNRYKDFLQGSAAKQDEVVLVNNTPVPQGAMQILIGKPSFDSLIEATFKEEGYVSLTKEHITVKVEDLENMAEGFSNAFDEDSEVKISA